jgi:hypothetical protein
MVRIAISQSAFDAIAKTLPLGSVGYENKVNEKGERLIWLDTAVVDRLRHLRGPGESYSDVILWLALQTVRLLLWVITDALEHEDTLPGHLAFPSGDGVRKSLSRRSRNAPSLAAALFLLCHAIELALKPFLALHGESESDLRLKSGHDLKKVLKRAKEFGLTLTCC